MGLMPARTPSGSDAVPSKPQSFLSGGPHRLETGTADAVLQDASAQQATEVSSDLARRKYDRVPGPFDGVRAGLLDTPIGIYDLSAGGCFVNSMHEQEQGSTLVLRIDLPGEGWITVKGETVYQRPGFGYAVRFIDVDADTTARLWRLVKASKS